MRRMIGATLVAIALAVAVTTPTLGLTRTVERIPWVVTFPAASTCTGEAVAVTGESLVVSIESTDGRVGYHMTGHVQGVGIGLTSSDRYRFTWTQAITAPSPASSTYVYTEGYRTSLRHLGSDGSVLADSRASLLLHHTIVDGRTVVAFEVGRTECR